jgi:hypothetical protein
MFLNPAKMTPEQRSQELAEILARGVRRALHAAATEVSDYQQKALEEGGESSADPNKRAEP